MSLRRALLPLSLVLLACGDAPVSNTGVARPNTRVLSGEGRAALIRLEADRVIFEKNPETLSFEVGHIIASEPTEAAPYGMLRKVTAVLEDGDAVILETRLASPHEALKEANVSLRGELTAANIATDTNALSINLPFEKVLWDADDNSATTYDQLRVDALFKLDAGYGVDYQLFDEDALFDDWNPFDSVDPKVKAFFGLAQKASVSLTIPEEATSLKFRENLTTYHFDPITVMAGPVPIVFVPTLKLDAAVDLGIGDGGQTYGAEEHISASVGFECNVDGCSKQDFDPGFEFTSDLPEISHWDTARAEVHLIPRVSLMLYGAAGIYGEVDASARLDVTPLQSPAWTLSGGIAADVGVSAFGFDWGARLFSTEFKIAESSNEAPQVSVSAMGGWFINGSPIELRPWAFDPETGKLPVTLTDSLGHFAPTVVTPNGNLTVELGIGTHVITATATDANGETTTAQTTIEVTDPAPEVTIHAPFSGFEASANAPVALKASALDGFAQGGDLPCTALTWSSSNPSDILPADTCGATSSGLLFATFTTPGERTLTLTADDGTSMASKSVTLHILPPVPGKLSVQALSPTENGSAYTAFDDLLDLSFLVSGSKNDVPYAWRASRCDISFGNCAAPTVVSSGSFDVSSSLEVHDTWSMTSTLSPALNNDYTRLELVVEGDLVHTVRIERIVIK
jgi:hypothetical protein